jgi:hypothetical protein
MLHVPQLHHKSQDDLGALLSACGLSVSEVVVDNGQHLPQFDPLYEVGEMDHEFKVIGLFI